MDREFKLPDIGEGISEVELLRWYVQEGDVVKEDQHLAEIETDKAVADLPSPYAGVVVRLHHQAGERIPVGSVLITIAEQATAARPPAASDGRRQAPAAQTSVASGSAGLRPTVVPQPGGGRALAAPAIRRRARELGIDVAEIQGSGPGGRVTLEDVERHVGTARAAVVTAATPPPAGAEPITTGAGAVRGPAPDFAQWGPIERLPLSATRRQIARRMVQSLFTAPHAAALDEADVTELETFRQRVQERLQERSGHVTILPFVMKAVVAALQQFPTLNASLDEDRQELILKRYYHVGIAVDTRRGLIVPVIRDVERKSLIALAAELRDTVQRTREGKIALDELHGGTFTLTNAGAVGGSAFIPIINYPEVAILGIGRAQPKPVVRDGQIVVRTMLPLSLSFDHRVVDGAEVIRFLTRVMRLLEDPLQLVLET
jgi:pyruvate dehydrogenase E2 component (dihydrolipoamide acetyltransferase)